MPLTSFSLLAAFGAGILSFLSPWSYRWCLGIFPIWQIRAWRRSPANPLCAGV